MGNNKYQKFSKNQFHYDSNGNMIDNQTGKSYTQSATNGQDVVIFGMPKMQIINNNDATAVSKQPIVQSLNRGEVAARLNAGRKQHRQQVGAAQDDTEQAKAYFDKSMREATQPTIYGKTANTIHNIANLGTSTAYMSGNPTAIAAASSYAIPSTLKRWFTEGINPSEMLANVTPVGRRFSSTEIIYPEGTKTPEFIKLDPKKDFLGVNINTGDANQVVVENPKQFADWVNTQWAQGNHGVAVRIGNGELPGEGLSHDSAPNWLGFALRKIRSKEGFLAKPQGEPGLVRLNTVSPKNSNPNEHIQWTPEYVDMLKKRVTLLNKAAGTNFPMPMLVHVKTGYGQSIPKVLIPNIALIKRQNGGRLWTDNNRKNNQKKLQK